MMKMSTTLQLKAQNQLDGVVSGEHYVTPYKHEHVNGMMWHATRLQESGSDLHLIAPPGLC